MPLICVWQLRGLEGAFCFIHGIGDHTLRALKKHLRKQGLTAHVHGNKGKKPAHAFTRVTILSVLTFLHLPLCKGPWLTSTSSSKGKSRTTYLPLKTRKSFAVSMSMHAYPLNKYLLGIGVSGTFGKGVSLGFVSWLPAPMCAINVNFTVQMGNSLMELPWSHGGMVSFWFGTLHLPLHLTTALSLHLPHRKHIPRLALTPDIVMCPSSLPHCCLVWPSCSNLCVCSECWWGDGWDTRHGSSAAHETVRMCMDV